MKPLEFIVCHGDKFVRDTVKKDIPTIMERVGIDYNLTFLTEEEFEKAEDLPQDALVYVHSNYNNDYSTVGKVMELAETRKDLKFIVSILPECFTKGLFEDVDRLDYYTFLKEKKLDGFTALNPVVVSTDHFVSFVFGKLGEDPIIDNLEKYLTEWKELMEAEECFVPLDKTNWPYFVICSNEADDDPYVYMLYSVLDDAGYRDDSVSEFALHNPDSFPDNSVVYVHGGRKDGHVNLGYVKKLAEKRPDLKFIIRVDEDTNETRFYKRKDYDFYYSLVEQEKVGIKAGVSNQITIVYSEWFLEEEEEIIQKDFFDYLTAAKVANEAKDGKA